MKWKEGIVLLTDDMIDTAGTVSEAARALKDLGASDVYVCATHALLSGPAVERLSKAPIKEVTVTDTVRIPEEKTVRDADGAVGWRAVVEGDSVHPQRAVGELAVRAVEVTMAGSSESGRKICTWIWT